MKENGRSFFFLMGFNERKCWDLMYHLMLDASGNVSFYDGTNVYVMRQENDHYFYHNVATITTPIECPATAPENASSTKKGV